MKNCPTCGALPGQPCRDLKGGEMAYPHPTRSPEALVRRLVEDQPHKSSRYLLDGKHLVYVLRDVLPEERQAIADLEDQLDLVTTSSPTPGQAKEDKNG